MFSTGSYHLPATGFERKVEIDFEHNPPEGKRLTANTCGEEKCGATLSKLLEARISQIFIYLLMFDSLVRKQ